MNTDKTWWVGIDVGAQDSQVVYGPGPDKLSKAFSVTQSQAGLKALDERLQQAGAVREATLVVMEATGTYWMKLATRLHGLGYWVSVINPKQAHHFAHALLKRSKTDAIDAHN